MGFQWTDEMIEFLKIKSEGKLLSDITDEINDQFNLNLSERQVETSKYRNGIKSYKKRGHYRLIFTDEIKRFIKNHHKGCSVDEMRELINDKFGKEFTSLQIRNHYNDYGLVSNYDTRYKSGNRHVRWKPVGAERIDSRGRTYVKMSDTGKKWKLKSHVVYEKANGSIPDGLVLMYLDRDEKNWCLDNLLAVDKSTLGTVVSQDALLIDEPIFNLASVTLAKLERKIRELEAGD